MKPLSYNQTPKRKDFPFLLREKEGLSTAQANFYLEERMTGNGCSFLFSQWSSWWHWPVRERNTGKHASASLQLSQ